MMSDSRIYSPLQMQEVKAKMLESLDDLRKYANEEFKEANLSDNEREMRIHLEYENRIYGIIKSL